MAAGPDSVFEMLKRVFNRGHGSFLGMLSDYIDGVLPERDRDALEAHLRGCPSCTEEMESLRATVHLLRRVSEVEAPRSFRLAAAPSPVPTPPPERPVFLWAMRVSTALAVVAFTVMVAGNATGLFGGGEGGRTPASESAQATAAPPYEDSVMEMEPPPAPMEPEPETMRDPTAAPRATMAPPPPTPGVDDDTLAFELSDADAPAPTTYPDPPPTPTTAPVPMPSPTPVSYTHPPSPRDGLLSRMPSSA